MTSDFIECIKSNEKKILVNIGQIVSIESNSYSGGCEIGLTNGTKVYIKETYDDILGLLDDDDGNPSDVFTFDYEPWPLRGKNG